MSDLTESDARLLELAYDSGDDDGSDVTEDLRCKYPSKFCGNARVVKASGKLHRFCELHRRRANVNQKRWTAVRRQVTSCEPGTMPLDPAWVARSMFNYYEALPNTDEQAHAYLRSQHQSGLDTPALNDGDIQMLAMLLGPTGTELWPFEHASFSHASLTADESESTFV